jgi:hypothetical protein
VKEDLSLLERLHHGLCQAVERDGAICFSKRHGTARYCGKHASRYRRHKSFDLPFKKIKYCKFIDCNNVYSTKGYCKSHYEILVSAPKNKRKKCSIDECMKKRGSCSKFCPMHNSRISRYGTMEGNGKKRGHATQFKVGNISRKKEPRRCIAASCDKDSKTSKITKGLCSKHYQRWATHGDYNMSLYKERVHGGNSEQMG